MNRKKNIDFYNKIFLEMYDEIRRFILHYSRDERVVDDAVQETFLEAYRHIDELMTHPNYKGWLYNTAKYKTQKLKQRLQQIDMHHGNLEEANRKNVTVRENSDSLFWDNLKNELSESDFKLLYLRYIEGYSLKEISKILKISLGACKMRHVRLLEKLKKIIT